MGTAIQLFLHLPSIYLPGHRSSEGNTRNPARTDCTAILFANSSSLYVSIDRCSSNLRPIRAYFNRFSPRMIPYLIFNLIDSNSFSNEFLDDISPCIYIYRSVHVLEDDAHAKNLRCREDTFLPESLSLAITLRPPFVSSDVETLRVRPRRDYKIALPPPREIFNLVYYRPATRKLCLHSRKLLDESPSLQPEGRMEKRP